ncbi:acetyl/propionyl/methylcrotonyl-CoA carboxylase subunit alpha [Propylenella binzhouense]|uniref:Acetyl/propionyl/methylcrotonyl-CoA carboxylase subunit alpha n=1 Tax=Propylenella binzhouense TaxID=2555902 RepID=A0A964WS36_9HYPH|nr:acetyl/propionyl/methylcrotonyl-CoA carboxylase subunit alpha [Propylenella binzhouense]MYZ46430.1 acetyl/propionyl/methylcrotonyl-CoA carboxylase subunit alpha [Propylenella binzhouense]
MPAKPQRFERRFTKLLIANRGEIACRIIRTARRMGLHTVAIFSEADADSQHVSMADEAVLIGPASAAESYLRIDRIIEVAQRTGAEAIHPGYGFLSENESFAAACHEAGIIFVGPPVEAIRAMASKSAAKVLMEGSGVPLVPGYHGAEQGTDKLAAEAERIGFPVLVKASAGGGGKGMRLGEDAAGFAAALTAAKREAKAAFGDDHVLIEKFIARPRHIEVQIFGDTHGNIVSLFERECTLQRRHQKVVEEAPSSSLSEQERERVCSAARAAGAAVGYTGAGTVEFVANDDGFYFIEMNTRLQVEHPVTEAITGLDLVEWQLRVAFGEELPLGQDEITRSGHAFEVRIYAEDPQSGFLPSIGRIERWRQPPVGNGIRIDSGFREGDTVTPHYDPMLAKLIVSGSDRLQALDRLEAALAGFQVAGVKTNVSFLKALAAHPDVRAGKMDTGFIERELPRLLGHGEARIDDRDLAAAAAAVLAAENRSATSPWDTSDGWMMVGRRRRKLCFDDAEVTLTYERAGLSLETASGTRPFRVNPRLDGRLDVFYGDGKEVVSGVWLGREVDISTARGSRRLGFADPFAGESTVIADAGHLRAPMPGSVRQILAAPGDRLKRGEPLLIMEAMKMEHTLHAPADGTLIALRCGAGDFVQEGVELVEFEADGIDP